MEFSYELTGRGWAEATITDGDQTATITVSYLTEDALGDLLAAVTAIFGPVGEGTCSWQEEPGEYVWGFRRTGEDVEIPVDWYDEWRELLSNQKATRVFEANNHARALGLVVVAATEKLLTKYGEDGYREKWHAGPFPSERLQRLREVLAECAGESQSANGAATLHQRMAGVAESEQIPECVGASLPLGTM